MSRKDVAIPSREMRAQLASQVKSLRVEAGMHQDELAKLAGVSRQTLSDIENGNGVPQSSTLARVLDALGVDYAAGPEFSHETSLVLTMMGTLIESIPAPVRQGVVNSALHVLAVGVREGASSLGNVTPFRRNVGAPRDTDAAPLAVAAFEQDDWQARQEHEHE